MAQNYLNNQFLIATPALADSSFSHTVTYLCEHTQQGALGIIINRTTDLVLGDLLEQLNIKSVNEELAHTPIYYGGPVQIEHGFVLHQPLGDWQSTLPVTEKIGLTMSQDIIEAIAQGVGPEKYFIALGYAGWDEGQLEEELLSNAWLTGEAHQEIIFDETIEQRWQAAASTLGVELSMLSSDVGHA